MFDLVLLVIAVASGGAGDAARLETAEAPPAAAVTEAPVAPRAETDEARPFSSEAPPPSAEADPAPPRELPYVAEQQVPSGKFTTAVEVKPILNATRSNWIAVREFNGQDLVYVTHLWSWRCGLVAIHIGINGAQPEPWPLPACNEDSPAPNAMPADELPYRAFALNSVEEMTVELIYDDLSIDRATFNRTGALIP
ncbi:hypothetical protein KU6B_18120 [Mameliella alba]|uniref:hypothetical protein n=1 Tax=Mameliella alba TaxID=561184 RepID=UPI0013E42BFE|nr:hypothetical protein [Mameliella alba]BBU55547.1 hypothetical protein KU6B_18120 [Mameliella alba]